MQEKHIIKNSNLYDAAEPPETEEQRRIAALEERISALETALTGTQARAVFNADKSSIVRYGDAVFRGTIRG